MLEQRFDAVARGCEHRNVFGEEGAFSIDDFERFDDPPRSDWHAKFVPAPNDQPDT
nr:hypothetical protein [Metallibacterium scheffleri]